MHISPYSRQTRTIYSPLNEGRSPWREANSILGVIVQADLEHLQPESNDALEILKKDTETSLKGDALTKLQQFEYKKIKIKQKNYGNYKILSHEKPESITIFKEK